MAKILNLLIISMLTISANAQNEKKTIPLDSMKRTKENSEHYTWGDNCSGWHLVKSQKLSIIEELMPPNTQEKKHFHEFSEQFFRILNGTATFEIENEFIKVEKGQGVHIPPGTKHKIRNDQSQNLEFIVISRPTTRGDRYNEPFEE